MTPDDIPSIARSGQLSKEQAFALADAVSESELAATASAYEDPEAGEWVFEATCTSMPDLEVFQQLARDLLGGDVTFSAEPIDPEVNWVAKSLDGLKPVVAGGFYVYGSHATEQPPAGLTAIRIDAAQAFGTGHHETTTGCLEAIDRTLKRRKVRTPLDVGTGTGVLAIAIAKRARVPVVASDIDPVAVRTTSENARDNGVGRQIIAIEAPGLDHREIVDNGPYDLIVANILAAPLVGIADAIGRAALPRATIILSGLLNRQAARVITTYARQGMILRQKLVRGDWATLILQRTAGSHTCRQKQIPGPLQVRGQSYQ